MNSPLSSGSLSPSGQRQGLLPSFSGLAVDPSAQPDLAASKSSTHLWTEFIQKWHLSICSLLMSLPRWALLVAETTLWNQVSHKRHWPAAVAALDWLAPAPRRTSEDCFLDLQVKWEKPISWFGSDTL